MLTQTDKVHLQKLLQLYNFSQLRPSPQIYQISVPEQQHFVDAGNDKKKRYIFYKVPYLPEEEQKIAQVKSQLQDNQIYENYSSQIILKHLYAAQFNFKSTIQRLQKLQQFQNNPIVTTLSVDTINKLKNGCIYTYGHDRTMKPIIIIRADKFDYSLTIQQNYNPVYFLMLVVLAFRNVPYHAQKYVNIFDLCDMNMTQIPYRYLYGVFTAMNLYYCGNTAKTYIYNAKGIGSLWSFAKTFIPEHARKKIIFIDQTNKQQVLKVIDPNELQKKYGGNLDNLKQFWPPKCTDQQFDTLQKQEKGRQEQTQSQFYSICNDAEFFEKGQTSKGLCGSGTCGNCNIF